MKKSLTLLKDSLVQAMLAFEKARVRVPYHAKTVIKLFQSIDEFWRDAQEKVSEDDLKRFRECIGGVFKFY